ncbi:MAG: Bacterial regulatory protein, luxR family [Bacteroidetes bacterium]|jgi:DNA-binding CsgD family transcriptional regulator|nr:Bacterial regulatory protein, luxR family [Bacteroidota bacterium]
MSTNLKYLILGRQHKLYTCAVDETDYVQVQRRFFDLEQITESMSCLSLIYDLHKGEFIFFYNRLRSFFRKEIEAQGIASGEDFIDRLDEESRMYIRDYYKNASKKLPPNNTLNHKEFRLLFPVGLKPTGKQKNGFLHTVQLYETDPNGNPWLLYIAIHPYARKVGESKLPVLITHPKSGSVIYPAMRTLLSERQREVAHLISLGMSSQEIADKLCLDQSTINNKRQQISDMADTNSMPKAIHKLLLMGLL